MIPLSWDGPVATIWGVRRRVTECASCGLERPVHCRGLCRPCQLRHQEDGTAGQFGYVKADRLEDYAWLRASGELLPVAAARLGVTARTAWRYEAQLAAAGQAPWRDGWPVVQTLAPVAGLTGRAAAA
jgi:hypothetical protein